MKKQILNIAAIALVAGSMTFVGCKKDDTTAPVITLTGADAVSINLHDTYTDAGATASDDKDGDITSSIVTNNPVNVDQCGTYTVTYNVNDKAGNAATQVTRVVTVKSDNLAGTYDVSDVVTGGSTANNGTWTYVATVTQSSTVYNKILIANFGGLGSSTVVYATVSGTAITIPSQTVSVSGASVTVSGSGLYSVTATGTAGAKITQLTYTAGSVYGNGTATYTKQ